MPRHLGRYPEAAEGPPSATVLAALRAELPAADIDYAPGCAVRDQDRSGFAHAAAHAREADVVVAVLGDEAGLFDRGTSGEGCDVADLRLPCVQEDLLRIMVASGTPVVLVLVTGRPYAIGPVAGELAGIVQAFFPGEEGGGAIAGVLSGRLVPSGRLPVEMPASPGAQPASYLRPRLAVRHPGSSVDPTPLFAFGRAGSPSGCTPTGPRSPAGTLQPGPGWWNRARSGSRSAEPRTSCRCRARSCCADRSARSVPAGCSTPRPRSCPNN